MFIKSRAAPLLEKRIKQGMVSMATEQGQESRQRGIASLFTTANLKAFLLVNLGVLLLTVGVYFFKLPNNFTTGGVSGLAILLSSVIPFLSTATLMAIINVLLLVLGYLFLGREFGFWTTYCSLMYSLETWILERVYPMDKPFTDQPLLELCFAMMLPAVGSALMFNYNASSGGTDIIAMILKKYTNISEIGKALFVSDSVIALASCFFFGIQTGMFSILGLFLKAFVVDSVIESINLCKFFSIVTSKPNQICKFIIEDLKRSSTVLDGEGAYSHQDRKVVLTAVRRGEAVRLRQKCKEIDPHSFMFITNTSEIIGKGFRSD